MASKRLLERYVAGEHAAVWQDLVALGDAVRKRLVRAEAVAVAKETMRRVRANLLTIVQRMRDRGFDFDEPDKAFVPASPDAVHRLDEFEHQWGILPLSVRAWYEVIDSINLHASQLIPAKAKSSRKGVLRWHLYGLVFHSLQDSLAGALQSWERFRDVWPEMTDWEKETHLKYGGIDPTQSPTTVCFLRTGMSANNCEAMGFPVGGLGADGVMFNDGGGDRYFVEFLRTELLWSGRFPGYYSRGGRELDKPGDRTLPWLTDGLLRF